MTLKEAIESGKAFRRWGRPDEYPNSWFDPQCRCDFTREDILADDWVVKTVPREFLITRGVSGWQVSAIKEGDKFPDHWLADNSIVKIRAREVID